MSIGPNAEAIDVMLDQQGLAAADNAEGYHRLIPKPFHAICGVCGHEVSAKATVCGVCYECRQVEGSVWQSGWGA